MKKLLAVLLCLGLCGCATASRMNNVSLGMTKAEVINTIGSPISSSAQGGYEYLNYRLSETGTDWWYANEAPYYIRLKGGKVESYGRTGDFDSTKTPETKTTVDLNIK